MLSGRESIAFYSKENLFLWMSMAFQAGLINMGGFMSCHRFVSHVTGFATFFGYEASQFQFSKALGMLSVPLFFLLGTMISAHLVDVRIKMQKRPKYYVSFALMVFLLSVVLLGGIGGFFGQFGSPIEVTGDYLLLGLLCLTCGIQNATVSSVSKSVVRTTHLTGIATDLGIGVMRLLNQDKIKEDLSNEKKANLTRVSLIVSFILGSLVAGFLFSHFQYWGFILPVLISFFMFALTLRFRKKS